MAFNLELKIKLNKFDDILKIISEHKIDFIEELKQKDIYYRYKNGLLKLRIQNDRNELIKYDRNEKGKERWSNYSILLVDGKMPHIFFDDILTKEQVVEKKRRLYIYKNTRIHLDAVKNLGKFIELETVVKNTKKETKLEFDEVVKILQLDLSQEIKKSYKNLLLGK